MGCFTRRGRLVFGRYHDPLAQRRLQQTALNQAPDLRASFVKMPSDSYSGALRFWRELVYGNNDPLLNFCYEGFSIGHLIADSCAQPYPRTANAPSIAAVSSAKTCTVGQSIMLTASGSSRRARRQSRQPLSSATAMASPTPPQSPACIIPPGAAKSGSSAPNTPLCT